jgi:hypothetical protein
MKFLLALLLLAAMKDPLIYQSEQDKFFGQWTVECTDGVKIEYAAKPTLLEAKEECADLATLEKDWNSQELYTEGESQESLNTQALPVECPANKICI